MNRSKNTDLGKFVGTVDQFLQHCSNINIDDLYAECDKRECIEFIIKEMNCSHEEALVIYDDMVQLDVKNTVDDLVEQGLVELYGYNDNGDPLYILTELGMEVQKEIKDRENKN